MTWFQFIAYLAIASGVRWLLGRMTPHADEYLVGGLLLIGVAWVIYRRTRGHAMLDLWLRSTDADRKSLTPALMDAVGLLPQLPVPVTPEERLTFRYPPVSRGLLTFQFWLCVVFGAGILRPLISEGTAGPGNDWVLFLLAGIFILSAFGARRQLRWAGDLVIVDAEGLAVDRGRRGIERIAWSELAGVRRWRGFKPLIFSSSDGREIIVWPELKDRVQFEDVVARRLSGEGTARSSPTAPGH